MVKSEFEKRLRKELRMLRFEGPELFLVDTGTVEFQVLKNILPGIFHSRVKITAVPNGTKRKGVFLPTSLENELVRELRNYFKDTDKLPRGTPLMATIPEELILEHAERHGIMEEPIAPRDDVWELLERLQRSQPQTKASLRKSFAWLRRGAQLARKGRRSP